MTDDQTPPTLKQIAMAAGVSLASVSKVLNNRAGVAEVSRRKIMDHAERLGYRPRAVRSLLKAGVEHAVLVTPAEFYTKSSFYEDVVQGILDEATAHSLQIDVRLVSAQSDIIAQDIATIITQSQPDAFIALGIDHPEVIEHLVRSAIPAVIVNGMDRTMRISSVLPDNWSAGWLAARTLLEAGHREIVHITVPHRLSLQRRLEGFQVALEEAGIAFDPDNHVLDLAKLGLGESDAQLGLRDALDQGRFAQSTAFFCSTDIIALGALQTLHSKGCAVPGEYSLIGVDDLAIAQHSRPALTTMRIDRTELGRLGVQMLLERIADPQTHIRRINTGVHLIRRHSVAPPA